jgi:hypothetical protein
MGKFLFDEEIEGMFEIHLTGDLWTDEVWNLLF